LDSRAAYPLSDLIQNEFDRLQSARCLLGEGRTEIFDFLRLDSDRLLPQVPNRQAGGEQGHANDGKADQVEAAIGREVLP